MGSVQTLKYDPAGFTSEIFGVSHMDSVSYFLPFAPLSPHRTVAIITCCLGLFLHRAKYMAPFLIHGWEVSFNFLG